jgi:VWFA-related protein
MRPYNAWSVLLISTLVFAPYIFGQVQSPGVFAPQGSGQYKISVNVHLVVLPVSVTDRNGHGVPDLRMETFRVYIDGRLQKSTLFKHEDVSVTVGLVVDNSRSMLRNRPTVEEAVRDFPQSSNPQDQMFVVNFSDTASLGLPRNVSFTDQPSLLSQCLSLTRGGQTALYDAMVLALDHLRQGTRAKKALIVVSDGGDNASHYGLRQVVQAEKTSNAIVYTVALLSEFEADQNPDVLRRIAKVTGGVAYFPATSSATQDVFRDVARDLREQYTVGFVPPYQGNATSYHKVQVRLVGPGKSKLHVRTRSGYYLPAPGTPPQLAAQDGTN